MPQSVGVGGMVGVGKWRAGSDLFREIKLLKRVQRLNFTSGIVSFLLTESMVLILPTLSRLSSNLLLFF